MHLNKYGVDKMLVRIRSK